MLLDSRLMGMEIDQNGDLVYVPDVVDNSQMVYDQAAYDAAAQIDYNQTVADQAAADQAAQAAQVQAMNDQAAAQAAQDAADQAKAQSDLIASMETGGSQAAASAQAAANSAATKADQAAQVANMSAQSAAQASQDAALTTAMNKAVSAASVPVPANGKLPAGAVPGQSYVDAAGKIYKYLTTPAPGGGSQYVRVPVAANGKPLATGQMAAGGSSSIGLILAAVAAALLLS